MRGTKYDPVHHLLFEMLFMKRIRKWKEEYVRQRSRVISCQSRQLMLGVELECSCGWHFDRM